MGLTARYNTTPTPIPMMPGGHVPTKKVCINMLKNHLTDHQGLQVMSVLQSLYTTEVSCFTYRISADGATLTPSSNILSDSLVIAAVRAFDASKKVTWSFGGGAQVVSDMEAAISTNAATTIATIVAKTKGGGYDGVKLDIENTTVAASVLPAFVGALRGAFNVAGMPNAIISLDVQTLAWKGTDVWSQISTVEPYIDNIYVMVYDIANYTVDTIKNRTLGWVGPMNGRKDKISPGLGLVDSNSRVLTLAEFQDICRWVIANDFGGIMVFSNYYMSDADYWGAVRSFFG